MTPRAPTGRTSGPSAARAVVSRDSRLAADGLDVLTTSQKLAHRIVRELKKLFRGRTTYRWSDDGSLFAVWERS
jgi:hypothetical protein